MIRKISWGLLLLLVVYAGYAQSGSRAERDACLDKLRRFFNHDKKTLSYQYQLHIAGTRDKSSQTLNGFIQVADKMLYDSCQSYIQLRNKDYLLQVNRDGKTVSLVHFERYKKLTGIDPAKSQGSMAVSIPMDALDSAISFQQKGELAEFRFDKQLYGFKYIRFRLSGDRVTEVEMSMTGSGEGGEDVLYTVRLFNIRQSVNDALFHHSRFYRIANGKVQYAAPYRPFQHYEVI